MLLAALVVSGLLTSVSAGYAVFHGLMVIRQLWAVMVVVVAKGDPDVARVMEQRAGESVGFCAVWFAAAVGGFIICGISALRFVLAG